MKSNVKSDEVYKTIGEITKDLNLIDKNGNLQTHTLRYWETQFKQVKPTVRAGNRRYYSKKDFQIIKKIKFLLKDKGLTINGVRKILNNPSPSSIDANVDLGVYKQSLSSSKSIKDRVNKISKIIKEIKKLK
tara:strand:- start:1692 stop:2087 length:396 start_codon:yes stop_codon:yes gene_type:complete